MNATTPTTGASALPNSSIPRSAGLPKRAIRGLFESEKGRTLAGPTPSVCDPVTAINGPDCLAPLKRDLRKHTDHATG